MSTELQSTLRSPVFDGTTGGPASGSAASTLPIRVFVVEDSRLIRERLVALIGEIDGVEVVGCAEGVPEAVNGILRTSPHAVVLDISLTPGSGLDVLREVHGKAPAILFIVLTNFANPQYRRICMDAGASHFLDKSCDMDQVKPLLGAMAAKQRAQHH